LYKATSIPSDADNCRWVSPSASRSDLIFSVNFIFKQLLTVFDNKINIFH